MSNQYYSPEELDAMPVGTEIEEPDTEIKPVKVLSGKWRVELWHAYTRYFTTEELDARYNFPKPTRSPLTPAKTTYPTPTLGELVSLRESYMEHYRWVSAKDELPSEGDWNRLNAVNKLIDERIGL